MNVEDMMEEDVETISADATGLEAAQAMSGEGIGSLVVVVEDGEISGIVTESDVIRRIAATESAPADVEVDDIMTRDPETVEAGTPVEEALELMSRENLEHLPVVRGGEVAGIITSYEILDHVVSEKEYKHLRTLPSLLRKR